MTRILFEQRGASISVMILGHAGYAPLGKDLVCAGVSTLAFTLVQSLRREEDAGNLCDLQVSILPGRVSASFQIAETTLTGSLCCTLQTIQEGFSLLAQRYPDYVRLESTLPDNK